MPERRYVMYGAVGLAVLAAVTLLTRQSPASMDEPQVTVVVDPEEGLTRTMPMETYIKGVVAGEMGRLAPRGGEETDWPAEAYGAQAILARTFAMQRREEEGEETISTDVTEAQAYNPDNITPAIEDAVERTRGEVLMHQGQAIKAWFHAYAGGHTATAKEGLNLADAEPSYITSREVPENELVPEDVARWHAAIPLADLASTLAEQGIAIGEVRDVEVTGEGPSGRVTEVRLTGSEGTRSIHGAEFRLAVGPDRMRSTLLDRFEVSGGNLEMAGRGFGHGVGLSQWDAYKMATEGQQAEEIVKAFFQGVEVRRLWD